MPRNPDKPRASEVHWLSAEEKEAAMKLVGDESFSNFIRRSVFNFPSLERGGSRKENTMTIKQQIAALKSQIATNLAYAKSCEATAKKTGRVSAANQAAQHRAAAQRKQAQIEKLEASLR